MKRKANKSNGFMEPLPHPDELESEATDLNTVKSRTTAFQMTSDGRFRTRSKFAPIPDLTPTTIPSPSLGNEHAPGDFGNVDEPVFHDWDGLPGDPFEPESVAKKRRKERPLMDWIEDREQFLSEFLRLEGKGDSRSPCSRCQIGCEAEYRCLDCDGLELVCKACILALHERCGLHRIEHWCSEGFFQRTSLASLGHRIQLGHCFGNSCPSPSSARGGAFTIIDLNGIHTVDLLFCNCASKVHNFIQLLRYGWFPASVKFPRTAFTLRLLRFYHVLSFESKATVFEFNRTLSRLTNNTGTREPKSRYRELLRVTREFSHLSMLKRSGRGHHKSGAAGTGRGELALLCPACPQVGINLPPDWEKSPKAKRFLYGLFIGLDANFRLKRKIVSSHASDPGLSQGWAYFVQEDEFKAFLHKYGTLIVQEPSKCSNHDAVNRERAMEGYAASGVATCDCTRHDMKRPNGVCDLQKGERYLNMDFIFLLSILIRLSVIFITVSYDIACQWSIHLFDRMKLYPECLQLLPALFFIRFFIPKFHLPAHILLCQIIFSLNYNKDCGRTDGEGVERGWDYINPIATSTREMGPGSRRDTLDAHFGDWNWRKTCSMANFLLRQIKEAVLELDEKSRLHDEFTSGLSGHDVSEWTAALNAWEDDHSKENPFEVTMKSLSQQAVRRQLAEEETAALKDGAAFNMHEDVSASQLITMGLDLENQQRRLAVDRDLLGLHATDDQKAKLTLRSNTLRRKIDAWIAVQHMYIPSLRPIRSRLADAKELPAEVPPHLIPLLLPSSITNDIPCDSRLKVIEWRLRYAQCTDALDDLRDALCMRSFVLIDKTRFQRGQRRNTRSQGIVDRIQGKVAAAVRRYRTSRDALVRLAPVVQMVGWETKLPVLKDEDIRPLSPEKVSKQIAKKPAPAGSSRSEGRRTVSWIWTRMGGEVDFDENQRLHESLRIEWCKSRARRDRWSEEVELLQEEMRRVITFFRFQADQWTRRGQDAAELWGLPGVVWDVASVEGRVAYAREQASQFKEMLDHCEKTWKNVSEYVRRSGQDVTVVPVDAAENGEEDEEDEENELDTMQADYGAYD